MTRMTEEDVKLRFITPAIKAAGWGGHQIRMEYCFTDGQVLVQGKRVSRGQKKRADYLLIRRGSGMPLAVVEAKGADLPFIPPVAPPPWNGKYHIRVLDVISGALQATTKGIIKLFGGKERYVQAVRDLARALYEAA